jgi:hypothetical protein
MDEIEFSYKLPNGDKIHVVASGTVYAAEYYQPAHVTMLHVDLYTSDDAEAQPIFRATIGDREWDRIEQIAVNKLVGLVTGEESA